MLPFFPSPYPDELLYSVCARYHQRSCNSSTKATMVDLFGGSSVCAVADLPSHLDHLSSKLPGDFNTPDRLISHNTLLPLYAPFLPLKRLGKIILWMKGADRGGSIHTTIGAMASGVPVFRYLRYCPQCLKDDELSFGETFWHRSHQPAGVFLCHKHEAWLIEDDSLAAVTAGKHDFRLAPELQMAHFNHSFRDHRFFSDYLKIARSSAWLLDHHDVHRSGLQVLHRKYLYHLQKLDLVSFSGRVAQSEFVERFIAFYGHAFLQRIHCDIDKDSEDSWLRSLVRKPRKATHPLRHFLLIHFLGLTPEKFFQEEVPGRQPFGRGPWPCLNPVASHFKKFVISQCEITRNTETGKPVGNFLCSCGFGYARTGPDKERSDRFVRTRILSFGKLWEDRLIQLVVEEHGSLRSAARILGVDVNTVKKHLLRLTDMLPATISTQDGERKKQRINWVSLMKRHPGIGRTALRKMEPATFTWLYRNDRKWLYDNLPPVVTGAPDRCRVDWERRDVELVGKILPAAQEIMEGQGKPVRVTIGTIGRRLGVLALLQKKLDRLPTTKAELERLVESKEVFKLRRIRRAIDELRGRGEPLQPWSIARLAGVRSGLADIEAEIEKLEFRHVKDRSYENSIQRLAV